MLLISDATRIPTIYHRTADKTDHYVAFKLAFGKEEGVQHKKMHADHAPLRKSIAGPYSFSNIKKMENLIDARMEFWIQTLERKFAKAGTMFDFAPWAVYMAYDIISEIGFGAPLGFVEKGEDIGGLIEGFHSGLVVFGLLCRLHPFTKWFQDTWLGEKLLLAKPSDKNGVGVLMRFRDQLLEQRIRDIEAGNVSRYDLVQT